MSGRAARSSEETKKGRRWTDVVAGVREVQRRRPAAEPVAAEDEDLLVARGHGHLRGPRRPPRAAPRHRRRRNQSAGGREGEE